MKSEKSKRSRRSISRKLFGESQRSFSASRKKGGFIPFLFKAIVATALLAGIYLGIRHLGSDEADGVNQDQLVEESFDPEADYDSIRASGDLSQLTRLFAALRAEKQKPGAIPVMLERNKKVVEIANQIIDHPDCGETQNEQVSFELLDAHARIFRLNFNNKLNDPFIPEQYFAATQQMQNSSHPKVVRHASVLQAEGQVIKATQFPSPANSAAVEKEIVDLLKKYPDDELVIDEIRELFTLYRRLDPDSVIDLARNIESMPELAASDNSKSLMRFVKDITVLYDSGIGNSELMAKILNDKNEFLKRLLALNADIDTGPTVITQLDNAIEYMERSGKNDQAVQLATAMKNNADQRTDPESKKLANLYSSNALQRQSIIGQPWSFEGKTFDGKLLDPSIYANRVVLVIFYEVGGAVNDTFLKTVQNFSRYLSSREIDFICVAVDTDDSPDSANSIPTTANHFTTAVSTMQDPHAFYQQCPTLRFPYALLVNKKGLVETINVSLTTMKTQVEYLLSED